MTCERWQGTAGGAEGRSWAGCGGGVFGANGANFGEKADGKWRFPHRRQWGMAETPTI